MDISDVNLSTLSKAFKLAARTRLKVGPFWCCYFMLYYVFIFISFMCDSVVVDFFDFYLYMGYSMSNRTYDF